MLGIADFDGEFEGRGFVAVGLRFDGGNERLVFGKRRRHVRKQAASVEAVNQQEDLIDLRIAADIFDGLAAFRFPLQILAGVRTLAAVQGHAAPPRRVPDHLVAGNGQAAARPAEQHVLHLLIARHDAEFAVVGAAASELNCGGVGDDGGGFEFIQNRQRRNRAETDGGQQFRFGGHIEIRRDAAEGLVFEQGAGVVAPRFRFAQEYTCVSTNVCCDLHFL